MSEWVLRPFSSGHSSLSGWGKTKEWCDCIEWLAWDSIPGASPSPEQAFHLLLRHRCQLFCVLKLGGTTFKTNTGKAPSFFSSFLIYFTSIVPQLPSYQNDKIDSELAHFNIHLHIPICPGCSDPFSPLVIRSREFIFPRKQTEGQGKSLKHPVSITYLKPSTRKLPKSSCSNFP